MLVNILESFSSLDEDKKKIIYNLINKFIYPIKIYLILLLLILIIIIGISIYYLNQILILLNKNT